MLQFDEKYLKQAQRLNAGPMIDRLQTGFYQNKQLDPDRIAEDILVLYISDKWRIREFPGTGLKTKSFDSFKVFVEHVPPYGLGVYWTKLKRICADTVAEPIFLTEVPEANPNGTNQYSENKGVRNTPPNNPETADRKLSRLKRDRPDLAKKVINGELSANAAYIKAGFAVKKVSVPLQEDKVISFLHRYFNEDQLKYIADHL